MGDLVKVEIPVRPEAAELLRDPARAIEMGRLVSDMLMDPYYTRDPLLPALRALHAEARANGLTDDMVDAEFEAYNAEHRI